MNPIKQFYAVHGDVFLEGTFILKLAFPSSITSLLQEIPNSVQVMQDAISLPRGLVMTIRKVTFSQGGNQIQIAFFKSKQDIVPLKKTIHVRLSGDALNGMYFSQID